MNSTQDNRQLDRGSVFRDGRWITAGVLIGSVMLSAACFAGAFTAFEITESNWQSRTVSRAAFAFLTVFGGLFAMALMTFRRLGAILKSGLIAFALGALVAYFPAGAQILAGPQVDVGEIRAAVIEGEKTKFRMLPASKTVSTERYRPPVEITMILAGGKVAKLKFAHRDLEEPLRRQLESPSSEPSRQWKIVHLPFLNRLLSAEPITVSKD